MKSNLVKSLVCGILLLCAGQAWAAFPPDIAWPGTTSAPSLTMPGYRQTVNETSLGTQITRISGSEMNPSNPVYIQHNYSKDQPWNHDMTLVKLSGAVYILNTSDWTVFRQWNYHNNARWSTVTPDILFYTTGSQFRKVNVRTNVDTLVYNFCTSAPNNCGTIQLGPNEGNLSIGDGMVVFNVGTTAMVLNVATQTLVSSANIGSNGADWVSISPSGTYVIAAGLTAGVHVYNTSLVFQRTLYSKSEHGDPGYDFAGNEVMAQMCSNRYARLDNAALTNLNPSGCNGHMSSRNYNRNGWTYLDQFNVIYAKRLDATNIVERFAYHRSTQDDYDSQVKAVVSPDGSKVMFNSDWGNASGPVYAYVTQMPQGAADTTAPSTPTATATVNSGVQITLSWTASTDAVGVTGYNIRRCTGAACTPSMTLTSVGGTTLSYVNTGLTAGTTYRYTVNAFDAAGNQGTYSAVAQGITGSTYNNTLGVDAFNRADGALGAAWDDGYTSQNAFGLVSNQLRVTATNLNSLETYNTVTPGNNQWCQITILTVGGSGARAPGCLLRFSNSPTVTGYDIRAQLDGSNNGIRIQEHTAGSLVILASGTSLVTWQAGDKLLGEVTGASPAVLSAYQIRGASKTLIATFSDSGAPFTSGKTGMAMYVAAGTTADVQIDNFAMGDITSTPPTPPTISTVNATSTQATVTWTGPPVSIRVSTGAVSEVHPIADFPGGVFTYTSPILAALGSSITFCPRDILDVENAAGCVTDTTIVVTDTTPPVLSNPTPSGTLPAGTTSTTISVTLNENGQCAYDTTDTTYALMGTLMTVASFTQSAIVTGLTDGSSSTFFVRCLDLAGNSNQVSLPITVLIAAATDVTPPIRSGGSPSGARPSGTTSVSMQLTTNENATCKYGTSDVAYASLPSTFSTTGTTAHSQTIGSLSDGNTYTYYVRCQDGIPNANTTGYVITWSITALPPDVSPPIRTAGAPSGTLAAGTTSTNMTLTTNEAATCKFSTTPNVAYASMASTFSTTGSTSHAQTVSGLTDNTTYTRYVRCQDAAPSPNANTFDYVITWYVTVDAGDTTAPTAPTNLVATPLSSTQVELDFATSTDAGGLAGHLAYLCSGLGCSNYAVAGPPFVGTNHVITGLTPNTLYSFVARGIDLSDNLSDESNVATATTGTIIDNDPPSTMTGLVAQAFTNSVRLAFYTGTDNVQLDAASFDMCQGASCSSWASIGSTSQPTFTVTGLSPSTVYCFRGKWSDGLNVSTSFSATVCTTTQASGLPLPRANAIFPRAPRVP